MSDEIKEIINYFKDDIEYLEKEFKNTNFLGRYITIRDKECDYLKKLLDCITNLQQENDDKDWKIDLLGKKLDDLTDNWISRGKKIEDLQQENERLIKELENVSLDEANIRADILLEQEDYKSRVEKVVEYITQHCDRPGRLLLPKIDFNYGELLTILQGEDNG